MNELRIALSAIADREGLSIDTNLSDSDLRPKGALESSLTGAHVAGQVTKIDTEILFQGNIVGTFERPCDRCLDPAREQVSMAVAWLFEQGVDEDLPADAIEFTEEDLLEEDTNGQVVRRYQGTELDLKPYVWEELILGAPKAFYCRPDCNGICPHCGINLNHDECDCTPEEETSESGMAVLKDMFPDLRSESLEE